MRLTQRISRSLKRLRPDDLVLAAAWDNLAEEISPKFQSPENTAMARRLFDPAGFLTVLELQDKAPESGG